MKKSFKILEDGTFITVLDKVVDKFEAVTKVVKRAGNINFDNITGTWTADVFGIKNPVQLTGFATKEAAELAENDLVNECLIRGEVV